MAKKSAFLEAHRGSSAENDDSLWGIGELADELGITARAIRFYESKGLLSPKRIGQTRIYSRRERARLQLILRGKGLGLSLREIHEYLDLYGEKGSGRAKQLAHVIETCEDKIEALEAQRAKLDETLAELRLIRRESRRKLKALGSK